MTTVEEHIAGLRSVGERMPRRFLRSGLLYEYDRYNGVEVYWYGPDGPFEVDGIVYQRASGSNYPRLMVELFDDGAGAPASMILSQPPTEEELDRWQYEQLAPRQTR